MNSANESDDDLIGSLDNTAEATQNIWIEDIEKEEIAKIIG